MIISKRAKYLEKKEEESGNITYIYSEKDIKARNKKKAKRLEKLNSNIKKLRSQVAKDLKAEEPTLKDIATVVALIDETYERIGNPDSASNDHHGVTTWKVKHVTFSGNKAKLKYIGKSGVKQEKEVTTPAVVKALKEKVKDKKKNEEIYPDITGKLVNLYLKEYKITAKDIRGFHANEEMRKALKENRKGSLPKEQKEKEKKLKEEFKKALETAAQNVGHEPATLKNQYLVPSIQETYLSSGKIAKAFLKSSDVIEFPKEKVKPTIKKDLPAEITPIKPVPTETPIEHGVKMLKSLIKKFQDKQIPQEDFVIEAGYIIVEMQGSLFDEDF